MTRTGSRQARPRTLVLGIGNILMGDEGAGVAVARDLAAMRTPPGVDVVDGGTGGFNLLAYFQDYARVILVDATLDGKAPGTVSVLRPRFASDYPPTLTAHDIGLKDLLSAVHLLDYRTEVVLFAISVRPMDAPSLEMSAQVLAGVREATRGILDYLETNPDAGGPGPA